MSKISKKICLIGDFAVGKTSLIRQFVDRQFSDKYLSTIGVKMSRKTIEVQIESQKKDILLLIWDIEGSNKFKSISPTYIQGASGAIIVGDVTRKDTLTNLSEHVQNFLLVNPQASLIIALNKSDLIEAEYLESIRQMYLFNNQRQVSSTYITSAKTGENVDEIFNLLAYLLL